MERKWIVAMLSVVMLLVSCQREFRQTKLMVDAEIEPSANATKAIFTGTNFLQGSTIGIFVYYAENTTPMTQFVPYSEKYVNIQGKYSTSSPNWTFRFTGATTTFDDGLYLMDPDVDVFTDGLAVSAYSPWLENVQSINAVPFTVGGNYSKVVDLMYAEQNSTSENARIIPDGNAKSVKFTFRHAMAMLNIGFKCKHDKTKMAITSVTLEKKNGGATELYSGGVFDAVNGVFNDSEMTKGESVTTSYEAQNYSFDNSNYFYVPFLIVPVEYLTDGDYILKFKFNGQDLAVSYPIKKEDIAVTEGGATRYEFRQGYSYTFNFTFNNFVQIDDVTVNVSDSWPVEEHKFFF